MVYIGLLKKECTNQFGSCDILVPYVAVGSDARFRKQSDIGRA